ncbi:uncharacterized protein MICPUCDRAFT_50980 [Micromonas pusilla CCMP1545]|uniref:Predicted protein n=1 Tax=Micromonas pusilla (strain CCMP1545) TaxID=564608 RepID=C1N0D4_MICPC|nr:uncharacterized protein MICPUCDRAFT_50980 [Micromonas pusilla CCMP1545]EEH54244.1 predicted protein [Micromonas pusilla CCMP1545]|eukprot:XP_003061614.1 predicted protein [Micromonas pusilla CCMP1545]
MSGARNVVDIVNFVNNIPLITRIEPRTGDTLLKVPASTFVLKMIEKCVMVFAARKYRCVRFFHNRVLSESMFNLLAAREGEHFSECADRKHSSRTRLRIT